VEKVIPIVVIVDIISLKSISGVWEISSVINVIVSSDQELKYETPSTSNSLYLWKVILGGRMGRTSYRRVGDKTRENRG